MKGCREEGSGTGRGMGGMGALDEALPGETSLGIRPCVALKLVNMAQTEILLALDRLADYCT